MRSDWWNKKIKLLGSLELHLFSLRLLLFIGPKNTLLYSDESTSGANLRQDLFFVGRKNSAGFDFPDYDNIATEISSGSLIENISSQNPTTKLNELHEDFDRLNMQSDEVKDVAKKFLSSHPQ